MENLTTALTVAIAAYYVDSCYNKDTMGARDHIAFEAALDILEESGEPEYDDAF